MAHTDTADQLMEAGWRAAMFHCGWDGCVTLATLYLVHLNCASAEMNNSAVPRMTMRLKFLGSAHFNGHLL